MSENTTLARPYSKAIFEHALEADMLNKWSAVLSGLAKIVTAKEASDFIYNPTTSCEQHAELLLAVLPSFVDVAGDNCVNNLINMLAENKRLALLPQISTLYELFKADQEKTIEAEVVSYSELTPQQKEKLAHSLGARLKRKVSIKVSIDPSILGGARISAGDLVIDGSIRGKLNKLNALLA